jgi:putative transcriptional regulator
MSGKKIIDGLHEAIECAERDGAGARMRLIRVPEQVDVKSVRSGLRMSQAEFANAFGFELATVKNWEQGRRMPEKPARILLRMIEEAPEAVARLLQA